MQKTIKLIFEFSKKLEIERVSSTIKRMDWYIGNGYSINSLSFPKNIDINNIKNISDTEINSAVESEYVSDKYNSASESLDKLYTSYEPRLIKFIESLGLQIISNITVNLTMYGIGGSYSLPNKVVVNISKFYGIGLLRNVLHEIIHLHIEHLIKKYKIGQWEKEAVVNLLFESVFPEMNKKGVILINTTKIESVYKENFPNIEKIISLI